MKLKKLYYNKRGTDKLLSVYWFAILFIVAAGIIYMTAFYYGKPYDVRNMEANLLLERVSDCFSNGGRLVLDWKDINDGNFLEKCNLNFNTEDTNGWKNDQYYVRVDFYDINGNDLGKSIQVGNSNLETFCDKGITCVERQFYTLDSDNSQYIIKIKSIVRKTEKNE